MQTETGRRVTRGSEQGRCVGRGGGVRLQWPGCDVRRERESYKRLVLEYIKVIRGEVEKKL